MPTLQGMFSEKSFAHLCPRVCWEQAGRELGSSGFLLHSAYSSQDSHCLDKNGFTLEYSGRRLVVAFLSRVILLTVSFKDLSDRHSSLSGLGVKL